MRSAGISAPFARRIVRSDAVYLGPTAGGFIFVDGGAGPMSKLEHCELRVRDIGEALAFNTDVLGLTEVGREGGTVYLSAGLDPNYDLAITNGGVGISHMAISVTDTDELKRFEDKIKAAGLPTERRSNGEPGQADAVRFETPNGIAIEVVVLEDQGYYLHPAYPKVRRGQGISPKDLDHINLLAPDVQAMHDLFTDVLDFHPSDLFYPAPDVLAGTWLRVGEYHHDVAIMQSAPEQTLHHVAWTCDSFDHLKTAADLLAQDDIRLEWGPGRHGVGGNLSMYFQVPGGNRYELCAEMPRLYDPNHKPSVASDQDRLLSAWGQQPNDPETFWQGT
jgi:catechol 2,3-dioxygenase